MRPGPAALVVALAALAVGCAATPPPRPLAPPPPPPWAQLAKIKQDGPIVIEETIETDERRWVGGTVRMIVGVPPETLVAELERPEAYWHIFPKLLAVRPLGNDGPDRLVELEQGNFIVRGTYTLRFRTDCNPRERWCTIRFWVDTRYPHSVDDAWGYFQMLPVGESKTLVNYGVRVDLGPGLIRLLFEERIRRAALSTPMRVRELVENRPDRLRAQNAGR